MWKHRTQGYTDEGVNKNEKEQVDSQADSGFLSGSNLMSSELSIDLENEERNEEPIIAPEPGKAIDTGCDLGLTDGLNQLSLKEGTLNALDSDTIQSFNEEIKSEEVKNVTIEPWELYYTQDDDGDTQLHMSIAQGFLEAAFYLISIVPHPCLLNIANDNFETALHLAVLTSQPKIVRRLILAAANPTVRNFKGNTPLHLACSSGDLNCVKALTNPLTQAERSWLQSSKYVPSLPQDLDQVNYNGETCLHLAVSKGYVEIISQLVQVGANLETKEHLCGRTALHLAIEQGQRKVIDLLLHECRPKLEARTYAGLTAYQLALRADDSKLAKELERLGATPSLPPELQSDSESEEEDEEEDSEAYKKTLARLGMTPKSAPALATA